MNRTQTLVIRVGLAAILAGCGSQTSARDTGVGNATGGGTSGTGGASASGTGGIAVGGSGGAGGTSTSGGAQAGGARTGGAVGTGGVQAGGITVTGGIATGGNPGSGGVVSGGSLVAGNAGTGGSVGSGGIKPDGGVGGTGGTAPTGGSAKLNEPAYFVSPTGSDTNAGTESAPFQTITKARDVVRTVNGAMTKDIYVYLRGGVYSITNTIAFGPLDSGMSGHRVFYQAYPGETPVLNGATKVTGWTKTSSNAYSAPLKRATKLRNLYVNDSRAVMTKKTVTSKGGYGTYAVTSGQAAWAWASGSQSEGAKYATTDIPAITTNKDDLEIVNGTTWNENIVCVKDVITTTDGARALVFQQPYGAIAQLPGWGAGFSVTGSHAVYNAFEFLNGPGQFFFDKTAGTLYYYPRSGEDMSTVDVEAPVTEKLLDIAGTSNTNRVKNLTFQGITFANTDYNLYNVAGSYGKASVQGATIYIAYGNGDWHASKYEITDTLPGAINVNNADSIDFIGNVVKHIGSEGISMTNDVINSNITGNLISDIAGSGVTVGHPQHVYLGDGGTHAKFSASVEGICTKNSISNNVFYNLSSQPGFGGHAGITAFFVTSLSITNNHIESTAYNGINLGWGWKNFADSTTCKSNTINNNRLFNTLNRLHDSGAIYTIGQMSGTNINNNYVKGIPPATSGPTYG